MRRMKRIALALSLFMLLGVNGINAKNAPKSDAERITMRVERLDKRLELTESQEKSIKELLEKFYLSNSTKESRRKNLKDLNSDIMKCLNSEQQKTYRRMLAKNRKNKRIR